MWRQRNKPQMKEQNSGNRTKQNGDRLRDTEFKILVIRILDEFRERIHELSDNFNKAIETIKKNQSEMSSTKTEMKNTV